MGGEASWPVDRSVGARTAARQGSGWFVDGWARGRSVDVSEDGQGIRERGRSVHVRGAWGARSVVWGSEDNLWTSGWLAMLSKDGLWTVGGGWVGGRFVDGRGVRGRGEAGVGVKVVC